MLTKEEEETIKEYKADIRKRNKYVKTLREERKRTEQELIEIEEELMKSKESNEVKEIKEEEYITVLNIKHKRPYKAYYICSTCKNEFSKISALRQHLLNIKGCSFLSDTSREVDKLISNKLQSLEIQISSYKLDLNASSDFHAKRQRLANIKQTLIKLEILFKNQKELYDKNKQKILSEYIQEYRDDIKNLVKEYYKVIQNSDLLDF